jgi:SAM-dependent methyltransferase
VLDYEFENPAWEAIAQLDLDDIKEHNVTGYKTGAGYDPLNFDLLRQATLGSILDFGCGIGRNFSTLTRRCKRLVGYDLPAMMKACRKYCNRTGDITLTDKWEYIESNRFDVVVAAFVFQHIPYGEACQELLKRLSKRCTRLYIASRNWADDDRRSVFQDILDSGVWELSECTEDIGTLLTVGDEDIHFEAVFITKDTEHLKWAAPRVMAGTIPRPKLQPAVGWKTNIAMAQLFTQEYEDFAYSVVAHNKKYTDRHGHKYYYRADTYEQYVDRHPSWHRIPYVLELFEQDGVDWVFWSDIDSVIMRPEIPLEAHLYPHRDKNIVLCNQGRGYIDNEPSDFCICFGQFFIRNCEWSKDFLHAMWEFTNKKPYERYLTEACWEQEAVNHLYRENTLDVQDHAAIVHNREFNSFSGTQYMPGDFMIHFAGVRDASKITNLIRRHLGTIPGADHFYIEELPDRDSLSKFLPPHGIGMELGVERGVHAESLFKYAAPKEFHLVDFWTKMGDPKNGERFAEAKDEDGFPVAVDSPDRTSAKWPKYKEEVVKKFRREPSVIIHDAHIAEIVPTFPDGYFDWIYIDSWHMYRSVKRDITLALPKLKVGGYLCGHDFDIDPSDWNTGPPRAVIETIQNEGLRMVALTNESLGDWVLQKVK